MSPTERFPGVTIDFKAVWIPLVGARKVREAWVLADGTQIAAWWGEDGGRWESPDGRYYFDREAADRACEFFPELLTHHIGEFAGQPFQLLEYQIKLLTRPIFGWKRAIDGLRRIRKLFGFIPKGGGKSPWAAGTGIYLARCDGEAAAEVHALANDRNQARTVHTNAKYMIEDSPHLSAGVEILKDSIYWLDTRSTYMVLSSDASSAHGKRPHGLIFDELHGYSGDRDRELFEALKKSLIKRRQPLLIMITHSGTDDEGVCQEEYEYAKGVLSGTIPDDTHLPVIFEASSTDDWTSPAVHARVNPGYGITVKADAVENECLEATSDPRKQNDFKRYHLNMWVNQATAWIPVEWWDACTDPMPSWAELAQMQGTFGIDMAQKIDLTAGVAVFRLPLNPARAAPGGDSVNVVTEDAVGEPIRRTHSLNYRLAIVPAFWLPEETILERAKQDRVPYDLWERQTWQGDKVLRSTEGATIDSEAVLAYVKDELLPRFPLLKQAEFGYDPAFATEISIRLRDGLGLTTVEVLNNYRHISEACQVFEALVKAKRIVHGGHKLLRWNLENIAIKTDDAGRIRPVKPKRATKRIDGIVATLIALSRLMAMPAPRVSRGRARVWTPDGFKDMAPMAPNVAPAS